MSPSQFINKSSKSSRARDFNQHILPAQNERASLQEQNRKAKRGQGKRYNFNDPIQNQQFQGTPINRINRQSPKWPMSSLEQEEIKIIPNRSTVLQDKSEGNLAVQTSDTVLNNQQQLRQESIFNENRFAERIQLRQESVFTENRFAERIQQRQECVFTENRFAEKICSQLINTPFSQFLIKLKTMKPLLKEVESHKRSMLFFIFYKYFSEQIGLSNESSHQIETQQYGGLQNLERWIQDAVKATKGQISQLRMGNMPQVLLYSLQGNTGQLSNRWLSQGRVEEALMASYITDKVFIQKPTIICMQKFKKQFNLLISQKLSIMEKSVWLFEFGMVVKYFHQLSLEQYGAQIYERYRNEKETILPCQLLLLGLSCEKTVKYRSHLVQEKEILKLVDSIERQSFIELVFLLWMLKQRRNQYPNAYKQVIKALIRRIVDPKLFLQILTYSEISPDLIGYFLQIYLTENQTVKSNLAACKEMKDYVVTYNQNKQSIYSIIINQWVIFRKLQGLFNNGKWIQFLEELITSYEKINTSLIDNFKNILEMMVEIITHFKIACNYKKEKIITYYQLLHKLEAKIKSLGYKFLDDKTKPKKQFQYIDLIQGCKTFAELKQGIFSLTDSRNLQKLQFFVKYLTSKATQTDNNRTIRYIRQLVMKFSDSREGQIFFYRICRNSTPDAKKKILDVLGDESKRKTIDTQLEKEEIFSYLRLLQIVNNRKQMKQKIMMLLEFS